MGMRILQLMNRVPWPLKDGGAVGFYNYTKGYADAGCSVAVAALNTHKHFVNELPAALTSVAEWHTSYVDNRVKPLGALWHLLTNQSYHVSRFYSSEFEQLLTDILSKNEFDTIVFESIFMAPYLKVVRQKSKAKCILRQHNVEWKIWETLAAVERNSLKKRYITILTQQLRSYETRMLNAFDAVVPVTEQDAEIFRQMGCLKPLFASPTGMHMGNMLKYPVASAAPSLFHLGSMEWMPNQDAMNWFLNKVWPKLHTKYPAVKLTIAGRGMPASFLSMEIPNVTIAGEVNDACKFMSEHNIMIVPLFAGSGIRIKILEGMAMGRAIVTTSLGKQGIAVNTGEELLVADDDKAFLEQLEVLINEPSRITQFGTAARNKALELYENNKVIGRLLNFYNNL